MNVAELIAELQKLPQDLTVIIPVGYDYNGMRAVGTVETATIGTMGWIYDYADSLNAPDAVIRAVVIKV